MMIKITKRLFLSVGLGVTIVLLVGLIWIWSATRSLPDVSMLPKFQPERVSEVYDQNGRAILQFPEGPARLWVPLSEIADTLQMAVITMEDDTFFQHKGINYKETWNAFKEDLKNKKFKRGGSTITQQLAKNLFLSKEKTLTRKLKEYFLAEKIEELLPKQRILELYLNEVEWGDGIYGAELASRTYFDKHASEVDLAEGSFLAAMLANPHYYNPYKNLERVQSRQKRLLSLLRSNHMINDEEYRVALEEPLSLRTHPATPDPASPACPFGLLRDYVVKTYGEAQLLGGGLRLKTTLDLALQRMLEAAAVQTNISVNAQGSTPSSHPPEEGTVESRSANTNESGPKPIEESPQPGGGSIAKGAASLLLAVKEKEMTRGLICVENGASGMEVIKRLDQVGALPKDYIFSFESPESFPWDRLFRTQAVKISAP